MKISLPRIIKVRYKLSILSSMDVTNMRHHEADNKNTIITWPFIGPSFSKMHLLSNGNTFYATVRAII